MFSSMEQCFCHLINNLCSCWNIDIVSHYNKINLSWEQSYCKVHSGEEKKYIIVWGNGHSTFQVKCTWKCHGGTVIVHIRLNVQGKVMMWINLQFIVE